MMAAVTVLANKRDHRGLMKGMVYRSDYDINVMDWEWKSVHWGVVMVGLG